MGEKEIFADAKDHHSDGDANSGKHVTGTQEEVKEVAVHSVALASAMEAQKPSLFSANMLRLYFIMGIGYLVSTMNGFGTDTLAANPSTCNANSSRRLFPHGCHQRHGLLPENLRVGG